MARLAHIGAGDVRCTLALRVRAVVARDAIGRDALVIELRWHPTVGGVAYVALLRSRDVIVCFTGRLDPVVTGGTRPEHLGVVNRHCRPPCRGGMACRAKRAGGNVRRAFAFGQSAVMAG